MYNRDAKNIPAVVWSELMKPVCWQEVLRTIQQTESDKSPGMDGVSSSLMKLLAGDEKSPSPLILILTDFVNVAFEAGQPLLSWKKAIISMIPKRKEDGSYTNMIHEMRPISVLQEFGKISSKILANRIGEVLLHKPSIMTKSQRAFLRDGSTSQCLNIALNILEDFKEKKKGTPNAVLFMLAYDQVKAYDCVQGYTIRASLERFNMPESFISYVLGNLTNATSCFKTFYGPTQEFDVQTSVRQGDPLSPLVYICITDALHEGLKRNPLYANEKTGYSFSNDPALRIASTGYADDTLTYESHGDTNG